jgi:hypothetical protein
MTTKTPLPTPEDFERFDWRAVTKGAPKSTCCEGMIVLFPFSCSGAMFCNAAEVSASGCGGASRTRGRALRVTAVPRLY